ncbi:MAG: hypothetical protein GY910_17480 [bacterium]|nr:hypothetical protein [bacterium]
MSPRRSEPGIPRRIGLAVVAAAILFVSFAFAAFASETDGSSSSPDDALRREAERGPVRVELVVRPAQPVIGDVIEVELEVRAEAGVEVLMPEFGEALGRFEIVDFAPGERLDPEGRAIARQKYRLQPGRSGAQSIPPLRVEFVDRRDGYPAAPEGEDAYEILTERIALEVAPILAADAPLELRPARADLGPRRESLGPWWAWALAAFLVVAATAPFAWRAFLAAGARRRQRSAYEVARSELDALLAGGLPSAGTMDAFYVKLSLLVRTYLEDRFGLRSPELTTQEFLTEMGRSPDLARSHQQLLRDFLEQADLVKFAGHRPSAEAVRESIAAAQRFLEETRDQVRSEALGASPAGEGGDD